MLLLLVLAFISSSLCCDGTCQYYNEQCDGYLTDDLCNIVNFVCCIQFQQDTYPYNGTIDRLDRNQSYIPDSHPYDGFIESHDSNLSACPDSPYYNGTIDSPDSNSSDMPDTYPYDEALCSSSNCSNGTCVSTTLDCNGFMTDETCGYGCICCIDSSIDSFESNTDTDPFESNTDADPFEPNTNTDPFEPNTNTDPFEPNTDTDSFKPNTNTDPFEPNTDTDLFEPADEPTSISSINKVTILLLLVLSFY